MFPRVWIVGNLITTPKEPERDRSRPKFYRPMPALHGGQIAGETDLTSNRQYGFCPGRSTTDAIIQLREKAAQMSDQKYVLAIRRL
jgi:hypothetical protein